VCYELAMRRLVQILILFNSLALGAGERSFAAAAPPKESKRKTEPYIYMGGGFRKPGRYDWTKGTTLADAVNAAGGLKESVKGNVKIKVSRVDGTSAVYSWDAVKPESIELQAGDKVGAAIRIF
jgi:hypothetical protein